MCFVLPQKANWSASPLWMTALLGTIKDVFSALNQFGYVTHIGRLSSSFANSTLEKAKIPSRRQSFCSKKMQMVA